jgi:uncharacterized protein with FMN-binding domain
MSPVKRWATPLLTLIVACSISVAKAASDATDKDSTEPAKKLTKAEADKIIDAAGKTQPDWWDQTPLVYPDTLDLTWPQNPGGGWQPKKDMGAYLWDIIDPNPRRWKEGVKLVHHTLTLNKADAGAQQRAMGTLSKLYTELLEDFPRGAYWSKKANKPINLAECYMRMGCDSAAIAVLKQIGDDTTRNGQVIKLWADLGDLKTALALASRKANSSPTSAYLAAGDACRRAGKSDQAAKFYEQAVAVQKSSERDLAVNKKRAAASLEAVKLFDLLDLSKIPDGTYTDNSIGYVGPVEVEVKVKDHKIVSVEVTKHKEKQFYASLTAVPARIVKKQSVSGIDATTGATITSEAIINASAKALAGAGK